MKKITLFFALLTFSFGFSQTFTDTGGPYDMQNGNGETTATCGTADELTLPLAVTGVGILGTTNVLESVTFNATHTWNADIQVELQDPSGGTTVLLIQDIGGSGDGFVDCILQDGAGNPLPTAATTPVTGTFDPLNALASFNGVDADGTWNLLVCDDAGGDVGTVDSWSLTFAPPPTCPNPISLAVNNITETTADLAWTETGSATLWNIEWGESGFTQGNGTLVTGTTLNPYPLTGLSDNVEYAFYVQADCGGNGVSNWAGPFIFRTLAYPPSNDTCATAEIITVGDGTCGPEVTGHNVGATDSGETAPSCGDYAGGDIWYEFTLPANKTQVTLEISASAFSTTKTALYDTSMACGSLNEVYCDNSYAGTPEVITGLTGGETYLLRLYDWGNNDFGNVVFCLSTLADCPSPINLGVDNVAETTADLNWTENGSATTWNIEWGAAGFTQGAGTLVNGTTDNPYNLVGLTTATDYEFYVQADCGGGDLSPWAGPFAFTTLGPPPMNDDCSGATSLTPGVVFTDNPIVGSNANSTASEVAAPTIPAPGCASYAGGDVWYSVVMPADGNLTLEMNANPTGGGGDAGAAVYSGSCGSLVLIECNDDSSDDGLYPKIDIADPSLAGQTLYFRAWEFGNNAVISFQVSAYSATLSVDDFESQSLFTYYPNPVANTLTLNAQNTIQNVTIFNMLGQQVLRTAPNAVNSLVDMSTLNTGSYFVKVTINDTVKTIRVIKN